MTHSNLQPNTLNKIFNACANMFTLDSKTNKTYYVADSTLWGKLKDTLIEESKENCKESSNSVLYDHANAASGLKRIIKWTGGKTNELKKIYPALPSYDRFFEPFVGGGSVYMGILANEYFINDFSTDLINLYRCIASNNEKFFEFAYAIDKTCKETSKLFYENQKYLIKIYNQYHTDRISANTLRIRINRFCKQKTYFFKDDKKDCFPDSKSFINTLKQNLISGFEKMKSRNINTPEEIQNNIKGHVESAPYKYVLSLFNNNCKLNTPFRAALYLYIKEFCFHGQDRYNKNGDFNVPYDTSSKKVFSKKLDYLRSKPVQDHFKNTNIFNLDFEDFLKSTCPGKNDFIFLDPPYDTKFSTYDKKVFDCNDHIRLRNFLLNNCEAKWMLVIEKNDFINNLYNNSGLYIKEYDYIYPNNYRGNNNKHCRHLLITNYPLIGEANSLNMAACLTDSDNPKALTQETNNTIRKKRNRIKYNSISQLTLDGKFVRSWNNIAEICKENPSFRHGSISKCIAGNYSKAYNFLWQGVKASA